MVLFSNVGISVYVALSNIFHFYFEKENHLQNILKLFFEGLLCQFLPQIVFFRKGSRIFRRVKDLFWSDRFGTWFAKLSLGRGSVAMLVSTAVEERPEEETEAVSDFAI